MKFSHRIFAFYVFFGLVPLVLLFTVSFGEYVSLIESESEKKMEAAVNEAADNFEQKVKGAGDAIEFLAENGDIRIAFSGYMTAPVRDTLEDKLREEAEKSGIFDRFVMVSLGGQILADSAGSIKKTRVVTPSKSENTIIEVFSEGYCIVTVRVNSFQDNRTLVGYIQGYVPTQKLTEAVKSAEFPVGSALKIVGSSGVEIFTDRFVNDLQIYGTELKPLGWRLEAGIPYPVIYGKTDEIKKKGAAFVTVVTAAAAVGAYFISRRLTVPIGMIVDGTKELASGNLDYRINMSGGTELKKLADAVDIMAAQMNSRQNELATANRLVALGTMAAGIAHEIKNPLAGLKAAAQAIDILIKDESVKTISRKLESEVDRLNGIVSEMLDFSRPKHPVMTLFQLTEVVESSVGLVANTLFKRNIKTETEIGAYKIYADKEQVRQVLINLLLNASNAIDHVDGVIRITSGEEGGRILLKIADNGCGIPEEFVGKIFDPFFSLSGKGTGLGMSVVYSLLKQNDAEIAINSIEGKGTEVCMLFKGEYV